MASVLYRHSSQSYLVGKATCPTQNPNRPDKNRHTYDHPSTSRERRVSPLPRHEPAEVSCHQTYYQAERPTDSRPQLPPSLGAPAP